MFKSTRCSRFDVVNLWLKTGIPMRVVYVRVGEEAVVGVSLGMDVWVWVFGICSEGVNGRESKCWYFEAGTKMVQLFEMYFVNFQKRKGSRAISRNRLRDVSKCFEICRFWRVAKNLYKFIWISYFHFASWWRWKILVRWINGIPKNRYLKSKSFRKLRNH